MGLQPHKSLWQLRDKWNCGQDLKISSSVRFTSWQGRSHHGLLVAPLPRRPWVTIVGWCFLLLLIAVPIYLYIFCNTTDHWMQEAVCHHPVQKAACLETQGWGLTPAVLGWISHFWCMTWIKQWIHLLQMESAVRWEKDAFIILVLKAKISLKSD